MHGGFISSELAVPSKSAVYAVRYVSCGLATDEGGELRDAYAYWDNQYRKWGLASISHAKAFANRFTARARGIHQTVLEWKATL